VRNSALIGNGEVFGETNLETRFLSVCVFCVGPLCGLPSDGGSSAGSSPLCGSPVGGVLPFMFPFSVASILCSSACLSLALTLSQYEQALICLSNREIVDASRGCTFHCKNGELSLNNRLFSLMVLA